jgi:hypothetical protein
VHPCGHCTADGPCSLSRTEARVQPTPPNERPENQRFGQVVVDTGSDNPCEQSTPASGGWMIRNNEGRNVLVTLHRTTTKGDATKEDQLHETIGPQESRELGRNLR